MASIRVAAIAGAIVLLAGAAEAQSVSLNPSAGTATLSYGWTPDPYAVSISNSPGVQLEPQGLAPGCFGYVTDAPDYRINYSGGGTLFLSATADRDAILVVNDANGNWHCDDDSLGNRNPMLSFANAPSGQYDVWVGAVFANSPGPATLYISNRGGGPTPSGSSPGGNAGGLGLPPPPPQNAPGAMPDYSLDSTFGDVTLASPTSPDPYVVSLQAGGDIDAAQALGGNCSGFIATAPDFDLYYTPGQYQLIISVASDADTTLVINDPEGNWVCDDNSGNNGGNPSISFQNPTGGLYDIWVGTYSSDAGVPAASLYISEETTQ